MCGLKTGKGTLPTTAGTVGQVCQPTVFNILIRYFSMKSLFFSVLILPCISWQKMWNLLKNSWELDLILLPEPLLQPAKTFLFAIHLEPHWNPWTLPLPRRAPLMVITFSKIRLVLPLSNFSHVCELFWNLCINLTTYHHKIFTVDI